MHHICTTGAVILPNQLDKSETIYEQAKKAYELRTMYKNRARKAMSDKETSQKLDEKKPAKTFEELLEDKISRKGITREEAIIDILNTASTTNENVNAIFGLEVNKNVWS